MSLNSDQLGQMLRRSLARLAWVQQNCVPSRYADAAVVSAGVGGGEVASADGMRFVIPMRTLHTGWNHKYFGAERGVTYYNFTSDLFAGSHGIVIPGTLRDSLFILAGLLRS